MDEKCLYLGTDPSMHQTKKEVVHFPFIEVLPRDFDSFEISHCFSDISEYTHILFTSKHSVEIFFQVLRHFNIDPACLKQKQIIAIGVVTLHKLEKQGVEHAVCAKEFTQEGMVEVLEKKDLQEAYVFYPRSSKSRPSLSSYLRLRQVRHQICDLYDTKTKLLSKLPDLGNFHEVVFTSPTTVDAFFSFFTTVPDHLSLKAIGPITQHALDKQMN